jgi:hypothetical protein
VPGRELRAQGADATAADDRHADIFHHEEKILAAQRARARQSGLCNCTCPAAMDKHAFTRLQRAGFALFALFTLAAPHASADMYKWVSEDGSVTYSNILPQEPSKVRALTRIETPPSPAAAKREATAEDVDPLFVFVPPAPRPPQDVARTDTPQRLIYRGAPVSAPRDPCLRSADPRCYERNKDRYHPFLGYTPDGAAVGTTSGASGGGAIGGALTR